MKATKRELIFAAEHFGEVQHTTLNPEGPGVVRIHLVPPKTEQDTKQIYAGTAIINGQDVIPVNVAWCVLLTELIGEINKWWIISRSAGKMIKCRAGCSAKDFYNTDLKLSQLKKKCVKL